MEGAVVEARVELAVPDFRERGAGDFVVEVHLQQRMPLDGARQEIAEAEVVRVGEGPDPQVPGHLALERHGMALEVGRGANDPGREREQF